jgi:hypothetical protein
VTPIPPETVLDLARVGVSRATLETGVAVEEAVGTPKKYLVLYDDSTCSMRLVDGFIYGAFVSRESALQFVRMRGLKLSEPGVNRQPDPPTESAETSG